VRLYRPQIADYRPVQVLPFLLADPECVRVEVDAGQDEVDIVETVGPAAATARLQDVKPSLVAGVASDPPAHDLIDRWLVRQDGERWQEHW
jgi:hypothetical protein